MPRADHSSVVRLLLLAGLWLMPAARLAHALAMDEITLQTAGGQQRVQKGEVRKETLAALLVVDERGNKMPEFRGDQVANITWDIPYDDWRRGMFEMRNGNYEMAAASLKGLVEDIGSFREVARPYLLLMYGECLYRAGKAADAAEALETLVKDYSQSRYVPPAVDLLVSISVQIENYNKAKEMLRRLAGLGPAYAAKAALYEAEMSLVQQRTDEAARLFMKAASAAPDEESQGLARLGLARCALLAKQYDKARQMGEQAITPKATPLVLAAARLMLGNVCFEQAQAAKDDAGLYLDAALEYLRIWTLYPGDERTEAEALYKAGECFRLLSRFPGRKGDPARAAELYSAVSGKYPGSIWAKSASKRLKGM